MNTPTGKSDYLLLFRGEHWDKGLSSEELQHVMDKVMAWFENLQQQGTVKGGQPLAPEGKMVFGKKRIAVDGPFAESKEAVGGYLMLTVDDLEAAVEIARSCPTLDYGVTIEVRPVLDECPIFKRHRERLAHATA